MKTFVFAAALVTIASFPSRTTAAILYGDFDGGGSVRYLDVTESNGTDEQKFGAPEIFVDQLDFNPNNFRAQSDGAAVIEESQLNVTIASKTVDNFITQVVIDEAGDFTLSGLGAAQAEANVGTNVQFTVTHANGNVISPVCVGSDALVFTPNASGDFSLPADGGTGIEWNGHLDFDVDALLASCGVVGSATQVDVVLTNALTAVAADGGAAQISKKDLRGLTITIPEPSSLGLLIISLVGSCAWLRRKRAC